VYRNSRFLHRRCPGLCSRYVPRTGKRGLYGSAHPRALESIRSEGGACFVIPTMWGNSRVITMAAAELGVGISHAFKLFDFSQYLPAELQAPTRFIVASKITNLLTLCFSPDNLSRFAKMGQHLPSPNDGPMWLSTYSVVHSLLPGSIDPQGSKLYFLIETYLNGY
jgi:hypothetical protein